MKEIIIQLVAALIGAFGFALVFNLRKKLLIPAALGGVVNWAVYLLIFEVSGSCFSACFGAAVVSVLYSEIAARSLKAPIPLFLVPSLIPSVPGSSLFYTMSSIASKDEVAAKHYALLTGECTLGIAAGMCLAMAVFSIINSVLSRVKPKL